ncbi:MAG TPA: CpsD/CapB family tyrosine-protein kinase [Terriglobales bacterium]
MSETRHPTAMKSWYGDYTEHMFRTSESSPLKAIRYYGDRDNSSPEGGVAHLADALDDELPAKQLFSLPTEPDGRLVSINEPGSLGAELLRTLAVRLRQVKKRHGIKKLLVASTVPGEGKTLISANLAITLSLHHNRVLLIDGDLRRASLSRWFDIADDSFGENWREHGSHRLPVFRKAAGVPLWVVPAGEPVEMPGDILQSAEFGEALAAVEMEFDWIVFDSPPLIPFGDATVLASMVDAIVLVTRKGVTPRNELEEALKIFDSSKIVATVLNCADVRSHKYYRDYYAHVRGALLPANVGNEAMIQSSGTRKGLDNKGRAE